MSKKEHIRKKVPKPDKEVVYQPTSNLLKHPSKTREFSIALKSSLGKFQNYVETVQHKNFQLLDLRIP